MLIGNEQDALYNAQMIGLGLAGLRFLALNDIEPDHLLDFKKYLGSTGAFKLPSSFSLYECSINDNLNKLKSEICSDVKSALKRCTKLSDDINDVYFKMVRSEPKELIDVKITCDA